MTHRERIDALLAELCYGLGVAPLWLPAKGTCGFDHPDGSTVVLDARWGGDQLLLHVVVTRLLESDA